MTIYVDDDLLQTPVITEWSICGGPNGRPHLFGAHCDHEGRRVVAADEVVIIDPIMRWVITSRGGYRLAGDGSLGVEYAKFAGQKPDK